MSISPPPPPPPPPPAGGPPPGQEGNGWNIGAEANGFVLTERGWVASEATRDMALAVAVAQQVAAGGVLVQQGKHWALFAVHQKSEEINHVLHLLLTLVTCGLWLVVWVVLMIAAKPGGTFTVRIDVGDSGQATFSRV